MADQSSFHGEWAFKACDQCGLGKGEMFPSPMTGRKAGMRGGIANRGGILSTSRDELRRRSAYSVRDRTVSFEVQDAEGKRGQDRLDSNRLALADD
jgi:hypothetical protein